MYTAVCYMLYKILCVYTVRACVMSSVHGHGYVTCTYTRVIQIVAIAKVYIVLASWLHSYYYHYCSTMHTPFSKQFLSSSITCYAQSLPPFPSSLFYSIASSHACTHPLFPFLPHGRAYYLHSPVRIMQDIRCLHAIGPVLRTYYA